MLRVNVRCSYTLEVEEDEVSRQKRRKGAKDKTRRCLKKNTTNNNNTNNNETTKQLTDIYIYILSSFSVFPPLSTTATGS